LADSWRFEQQAQNPLQFRLVAYHLELDEGRNGANAVVAASALQTLACTTSALRLVVDS
jgi:hypothetical protein